MSAAIPFRSLISNRFWKHLLALMASLLVVGGLVAAACFERVLATAAGPGVSKLLTCETPVIARWLATVLLFVSGQLALLVWWVRKHSERDFGGEFRIWKWVAAGFIAASFCVGTQAPLLASASLVAARPALEQSELLLWLGPCGLAGAFLLWRMDRDMRSCRSSLVTLRLAGTCLVGTVVVLSGFAPVVPGAAENLLLLGLPLNASALLFHSLLLHARFVLYEDPEPPTRRAGWLRRLSWKVRTRSLRRRGSSSDTDSNQPAEIKGTSRFRFPKMRIGRRRKAAAPTPAEPDVAASEPDKPPKPEKPAKSTAPKRSQGNDSPPRVDPPADKNEALRGLSKKERRKLRKQWREAERAGRSQNRS